MTGTSTPHRTLGTTSLAAIVVANMIGAGVFTTSGFALADLGSPGRVLVAWAVGGVIALLGALCYGALAARLRESGGEYLFLSRTLHPLLGFLAGWVSLWAGFTGAIALAAEAAQAYLAPWLPPGLPVDLVGSVVILGAGLLHAAGTGPGARVQNALVALKLVALLALAGYGAMRLRPTDPAASVSPILAHEPGPLELGAFAVTLMWISLSYSGWNAAVYVAGEARDPTHTVPRALFRGTLLVTVLYLALNTVFVLAAPVDDLAGRPDVAAAAAAALGGPALGVALRTVIVLALLTSVSSMVMVGPRVYAAMADDGLLPRWLGRGARGPRRAIALQVALALVVLWSTGLRAQLTNLGWILGLSTALSAVGLLVLRDREGRDAVPIPGGPLVPAVFIVLVLGLAGLALDRARDDLTPALAVLGSGVLAYGCGALARARRAPPGARP